MSRVVRDVGFIDPLGACAQDAELQEFGLGAVDPGAGGGDCGHGLGLGECGNACDDGGEEQETVERAHLFGVYRNAAWGLYGYLIRVIFFCFSNISAKCNRFRP